MLVCRLSLVGFNTVSALTFTVQINYCATVIWSCLDINAPPGWNTYGPYVTESLSGLIASQMYDRVSLDIAVARGGPFAIVGHA